MNKRQADELWSQLRQSLLDTRAAILNIIETKAWLPLGYKTFTKAWTERMGDIDLAAALLTHVVYQMLAEDISDAEIAAAVKGVGPTTAAALRRQRESGVPADLAAIRTPAPRDRGHGSSGTVFLHVGPETRGSWLLLARENDTTIEEVVIEAARRAFDSLAAMANAH